MILNFHQELLVDRVGCKASRQSKQRCVSLVSVLALLKRIGGAGLGSRENIERREQT